MDVFSYGIDPEEEPLHILNIWSIQWEAEADLQVKVDIRAVDGAELVDIPFGGTDLVVEDVQLEGTARDTVQDQSTSQRGEGQDLGVEGLQLGIGRL